MNRMMIFLLAGTICLGLAGCSRREPDMTEVTNRTVPTLTNQDPTEPVLAEQVIYDAEGIRITVKGMEENTVSGIRIPILVENGTDRNIVFSGDLFVVNGVTLPGYLYAEAAAGTKTNDAVEFYTDVLDSAAIDRIRTLRGYDARIVDTDTYETLAQVPLELTTTHAGAQEKPKEESGVVLYEEAGIRVIAQVISDAFYGKTVQLLVTNETGRDIIVEADNVSVNGYTVDAWLYDTVVADTVRYCQLDLFETSLAENGIDQVEAVSFRLNVLDAVSFEAVAQSQVLTVEVVG